MFCVLFGSYQIILISKEGSFCTYFSAVVPLAESIIIICYLCVLAKKRLIAFA